MVSATTKDFPYSVHPCWADKRTRIWERIHLPVAHSCNIKCAYCDHLVSCGCHVSKPGISSRVIGVEEAVERAVIEIARRPNLRIVAVSGPGEPLANMETFELMGRIKEISPDMEFCLSTNGVLLTKRLDVLVDLGIKALSVTLNTLDPLVASLVYEWAILDDEILSGIVMGRKITTRQAQGISMAVESGILVKVNTILIPGINDHEIADTAESIADIGVSLHNIVPLVPCSALVSWQPPSPQKISDARKLASNHIRQFQHCRQCRSDAVGLPEKDEII